MKYRLIKTSPYFLNYVYIIFFIVLINAIGLFTPVLSSNDGYFYAVIAKNIVNHNDWINLIFANKDWLDKPHFPFWLTALSFKIFGINPFAYILPGFIFNLIGAIYTYKLAQNLFNKEIALISAVCYLSSLHLLISSIDIRAEAYLLGEIIPACYYWRLYYSSKKLNYYYLLGGGTFSALALITKGLFVLFPIASGIVILLIYKKQVKCLISIKSVLAIFLTIVLITPELLALYIQFDMHPEKVIFKHTHVSGIKFFLWDSQFGRFFDNGPIVSGHKHFDIAHYFFFVHTFLWSFLPWAIIFLASVYKVFIKANSSSLGFNKTSDTSIKEAIIFLTGSFLPTFILFSLTRFQLDYYINILIPFAAIFCAYYLYSLYNNIEATNFSSLQLIIKLQNMLDLILIILIVILSYICTQEFLFSLLLFLSIMVSLLLFYNWKPKSLFNFLLIRTVIVSLVFIFATLLNIVLYSKFDAGYQINNSLKKLDSAVIIDYDVNLLSLEFNSMHPYKRINKLSVLKKVSKPYYLIIHRESWGILKNNFHNYKLIEKVNWIPQDRFIKALLQPDAKKLNTHQILVIKVE